MQPEELEAVVRRARKRPLWEPGRTTRAISFGRPDVERILPHRDPFLFVDAITAVDLEQAALSGRRTICPDDPIFVGHFPGQPIYPGVLQIETMGQLGVCLAHFANDRTHEIAADARPTDVRAFKVHHALFQAEVLPGDELAILATLLHADAYTAICAGQLLTTRRSGAASEPTICALAVMEVYFVDA